MVGGRACRQWGGGGGGGGAVGYYGATAARQENSWLAAGPRCLKKYEEVLLQVVRSTTKYFNFKFKYDRQYVMIAV